MPGCPGLVIGLVEGFEDAVRRLDATMILHVILEKSSERHARRVQVGQGAFQVRDGAAMG